MHALVRPAVLKQYSGINSAAAGAAAAAARHAAHQNACCKRPNASSRSVCSAQTRPEVQSTALQHNDHLPQAVAGTVALYAISDLHTDYALNMAWVQQLDMTSNSSNSSGSSSSSSSRSSCDVNVLLVAGDISDDLVVLRATLEALVSKFTLVAFVPGNHELWVKASSSEAVLQRNGGASDSVAKLHKVLELCGELGVLTQPAQLGGLLLLPLLSWHHQSWDKEADIPAIPRASAMTISDYAACKWPEGLPGAQQLGSADTAAWFDAANEHLLQPGWSEVQQALQGRRSSSGNGTAGLPHVVSFSHFLPHQSLLPEKRMLSYPNLAKAVGSDLLWQRLQQLQPNMHVFGHSHFAWDQEVQGIRCVQAPLCYPAERVHRLKSVVLHNARTAQPHRNSNVRSELPQQQQQQPHPLHVGLQDHYVQHVEWLPVKVYEASYTAELQAGGQQQLEQQQQQEVNSPISPGSNSSYTDCSSRSRRSLHHLGVPILHTSQQQQLLQQQVGQQQQKKSSQQQVQAPGSVAADSSHSHVPEHYLISSWQGSWCGSLGGMWSEYYKVNARQPGNVQLAPWVLKRYRKFKRLSQRLTAGSDNSSSSEDG